MEMNFLLGWYRVVGGLQAVSPFESGYKCEIVTTHVYGKLGEFSSQYKLLF